MNVEYALASSFTDVHSKVVSIRMILFINNDSDTFCEVNHILFLFFSQVK